MTSPTSPSSPRPAAAHNGRGTATIPSQPPVGSSRAGGAGLLGTALQTRERHNGRIALALFLIVGLAGGGAYLYSSAGSKTPVVEVVRQVQVGQALQRADLTTIDVSGPVTAFGGARLEELVGQRAAVTLVPHTLLQKAMIAQGQTLQTGQAQVGVAVTSGQIPADGLEPGDVVRVLRLPDKNAAGASVPAVLAAGATVFSSVPDPTTNGSTLLTLVVPDANSNQIAAASGAGLVALVKVPGSGS